MPTTGPTTEIGHIGNLPSWSQFFVDQERTKELRWPQSVKIYDMMRTDSHLEGLFFALEVQIIRGKWMLDANGAPDEAVSLLAEDLGVNIVGKEVENIRSRQRVDARGRDIAVFDLKENLLDAIDFALTYGHMYFEQVGEIRDGKWRLQKLAPREPDTIYQFGIERDTGQLDFIEQIQLRDVTTRIRIPANRLVPFIWGRGSGNWVGRSLIRSCYRNWLVKDRIIRVDAINHEKAGGVPVVTAPKGATNQEIEQLSEFAQDMRVGEEAGGALPFSSELRTYGAVSGGANPALQSIRYHDGQMSRRFLATFMELAESETGSRALGGSLIDWFMRAQEMVSSWYADIFNHHIIADWMRWNYGEDEAYLPLLKYDIGEEPQLTIDELKDLIDGKAVYVDHPLREYLRKKYSLPEEDPEAQERIDEMRELAISGATNPPTTPQTPKKPKRPTPEGEESDEDGDEDGDGDVEAQRLPEDRDLRRQPTELEVAAQIDFARVEEFYLKERDSLVENWISDVRTGQLTEAQEQIISADGDLEEISSIRLLPSEGGATLLSAVAVVAMREGIDQATNEAREQGHILNQPKVDDVIRTVQTRARALNILLANAINTQIADAAGALTGGGLLPDTVGETVRRDLVRQGVSYLRDQFGGLVAQATSEGRIAVMRSIPDDIDTTFIASELLDVNTCGPCTAVDGKRYGSIDDSLVDYPSGQFGGCEGRRRCRGFISAVYGGGDA